jgi:hypothetical protein
VARAAYHIWSSASAIMIIAPDFIFVHLSKTGGTFAAEALRKMLCPSALGRKIHRLKTHHGVRLPLFRYGYDEGEQHGLCNDIPSKDRGKTIISCIRNPFALYVSEYTFNWWKKFPERWFHDSAAVERAHPNWRELSFEEFVSLSNQHAWWVQRTLVKHPNAKNVGWYSHKFIYYYCRDHDFVFEAADDGDLLLQRVRESMYPIHFIHTERLNQELFEFLLSKGYPKKSIEFIPSKRKINSSRKDYNWRKWYPNGLRQEIEQRDALIFRLFPEFQF